MIFATFLSPIDVFDNEVKRIDYKPIIHHDSATISIVLMNIACTSSLNSYTFSLDPLEAVEAFKSLKIMRISSYVSRI